MWDALEASGNLWAASGAFEKRWEPLGLGGRLEPLGNRWEALGNLWEPLGDRWGALGDRW